MIHTPVSSRHLKLFAPYLPQSNKHGIGALAATNLRVKIDPYPDMDAGDLIELFWGECYVASTLLSESDIGYTLGLHVPESFLQKRKDKDLLPRHENRQRACEITVLQTLGQIGASGRSFGQYR